MFVSVSTWNKDKVTEKASTQQIYQSLVGGTFPKLKNKNITVQTQRCRMCCTCPTCGGRTACVKKLHQIPIKKKLIEMLSVKEKQVKKAETKDLNVLKRSAGFCRQCGFKSINIYMYFIYKCFIYIFHFSLIQRASVFPSQTWTHQRRKIILRIVKRKKGTETWNPWICTQWSL